MEVDLEMSGFILKVKTDTWPLFGRALLQEDNMGEEGWKLCEMRRNIVTYVRGTC